MVWHTGVFKMIRDDSQGAVTGPLYGWGVEFLLWLNVFENGAQRLKDLGFDTQGTQTICLY